MDWKSSPQPLKLLWAVLLTGQLFFKFMFLLLAGFIFRIPLLGFYAKILMRKHPWFKGEDNISMVIDHKSFIRVFTYFTNELWYRTAIVGQSPPDVDIINLQTKDLHSLRALERHGRPLVVSFGSCT